MNKETSSRISHIAGVVMNATADGNETPEDFARLLADAKRLAGSCMSQDETPGQAPTHATHRDMVGLGEFVFVGKEIDDPDHITFVREGEERLVNVEDLDDFWLSLDENFSGGTVVDDVKKPAGDFHSRLKDEREDLDRRLTALNSFLAHNLGQPTPRHYAMLTKQAQHMSEYLAVIDERLCDIAISQRSAPVEEIPIGNEDDGA